MTGEIMLYASPGTCSRVAMTALEETGLRYATTLVRLMRQQHLSTNFREKNPLGKVPSITVDGANLSENIAIITWLNARHPEAELLPSASSDLEQAQQLAHLCFCSSTLHPIVSRIAFPANFASAEAAPQVRARAEEMMRRFLAVAEERLVGRNYWYGERWSIMDSYLSWIYARITGVGFDASDFPQIGAMVRREVGRPSALRVAAAEAGMQARLAEEAKAG